MSQRKDVTSQVEWWEIDGELLPLTKCVCGKEFGYWEFSISIYPDNAYRCPECGRKLYFSYVVTIYEVINGST